jgi:hypothetical protein
MNCARLVLSVTRWLLLPGMAVAAAGMSGCSTPARGEQAIPPSAQVLSSGQNGLVTATPNVAGTAYVYDASSNRLIYSGLVESGDKIVVDPGASLITINAVTVSEPHLFTDHEYMIKFDHP